MSAPGANGHGHEGGEWLAGLIREAEAQVERLERLLGPLELLASRLEGVVGPDDEESADVGERQRRAPADGWPERFVVEHPELAQPQMQFADAAVLAALHEAIRRLASGRVEWRRAEGAVETQDVADVLFGRECFFEIPALSHYLEPGQAEARRALRLYLDGPQPTSGDVRRVGRVLTRLAGEGAVRRYRVSSFRRVLWAPASMEAGVGARIKRLAKPLGGSVSESAILSVLLDRGEPMPFPALLAAVAPAGGDVKRWRGHVGVKLGRRVKQGLVERRLVDRQGAYAASGSAGMEAAA